MVCRIWFARCDSLFIYTSWWRERWYHLTCTQFVTSKSNVTSLSALAKWFVHVVTGNILENCWKCKREFGWPGQNQNAGASCSVKKRWHEPVKKFWQSDAKWLIFAYAMLVFSDWKLSKNWKSGAICSGKKMTKKTMGIRRFSHHHIGNGWLEVIYMWLARCVSASWSLVYLSSVWKVMDMIQIRDFEFFLC